ncbi:MAG: Ig-like domain-containing protein [Candidatus Atribacteria bacterium]
MEKKGGKKKVYMVVVVVAIIAIVIVVWAVWLRGPKVAKIELSVEPSTLVADDKSTAVVTAKIFDAEDNPIPNRTVEFKLSYLYRGGNLKEDKVTTDKDGKASTTYTAGTKAGERRITASADDKSKIVTINLTEKE